MATFPGSATAQISFGRYHRAPWGDASRFLPAPGFQVFAERGAAWLEMPEKIQWSSAAGTKEERLALEPTVGDVLNDQFHRLVRGDHSLAPTIRDALEIARLVEQPAPRLSASRSVIPSASRSRGCAVMGMEPENCEADRSKSHAELGRLGLARPLLAALAGLALIVDASFNSSATYDEVAYLRVAARWWRTGDQAEITRMGSPLTFWKLQQVPVLWLLDHSGHRDWIDDPIGNQRQLLPLVRLGSAWIWLAAFVLTVAWSRRQLRSPGDGAGGLAVRAESQPDRPRGPRTMELPLVAATTAMFWLFWRFLETDRSPWFWAAAAVGGLAFSCKFTAILVPPILAVVWWVARWQAGDARVRSA